MSLEFKDFKVMIRCCFPQMRDEDVRWRNLTEEERGLSGFMAEHPCGLGFAFHPDTGWSYCSGRSSTVYNYKTLVEAIEAEERFYNENMEQL